MSNNPAILLFGMNSKAVDASSYSSILSAFKEHADELGADGERAITVRSNGQKVESTSPLVAGQTYAVSIALGDKG